MEPPKVESKLLDSPDKPRSMRIVVDKQPFVVWVVPGQTVHITAGPHTISFQVPE